MTRRSRRAPLYAHGKPLSPSRLTFDPSGHVVPEYDTSGMFQPVLCLHCGTVYDLGGVTVTGRYSDCSVWTTPCCGVRGVDDRPGVAERHYRHVEG
jgi:hypothetical protein